MKRIALVMAVLATFGSAGIAAAADPWMPSHAGLAVLSAGIRRGVAVMGDSTTHGLSGGGAGPGTDLPGNLEWPRWAEMKLWVPFYNRARDGDNTTQMLARWSADMTPLAWRCKYALIVAGINDINSGQFPAGYIEANIEALRQRAIADGMIPVVGTITPGSWSGQQEADRLTVNAWILSSFESIDLATVTADPANQSVTANATDPAWFGPYPDGIHYGPAAKRAVGLAVAAWPGWQFNRPTRNWLSTTLRWRLLSPAFVRHWYSSRAA